MWCRRRFISFNEYATLAGQVDNGGGCAYVSAGGMWETSAPSSQFAVTLFFSLKNIVFKEIILRENIW